jgi:putative nucleotidyltransferase with HDIG domain
MGYPSREEALALLHEHTESPALRAHGLAVEAAMRRYARHFGEDEDAWGVTGLLHDFDYERHPSIDGHPFRGVEILRERGYDEEMLRAVLSHAPHTGVPRETRMAKTLFAVDELCGLITAVAYVRPSKRLSEVTVKSVTKKMKAPGFARNIRREDIVEGAAGLGVDLEEHIGRCIEAMQSVAASIGL